ncbi:hypothetical protein JD844_018275 [Phrynosoma platyrhinos]|uniref:LEM domain-containing protein n=1 Tax=Phrynosoma platyrhinos TaxID=52577 RepID=A0ABQ7SN73_PHRPL|nr:hypothetical protein JD844_018275 [Phrynosoma platyrhinos]
MAAAGLSDSQLRAELLALGYQPGPITDSTRKLYAKKLTRLRAEVAAGLRSRRGEEGGTRSPSGPPRPKAGLSPKAAPRAAPVRRESSEEEGEEEGTHQLGSPRNHWGSEGGLSPWRSREGATSSSPWASSIGRLEAGTSSYSSDGVASSSLWGAERAGGVGLASSKWWERDQSLSSGPSWAPGAGGSSPGFTPTTTNRACVGSESRVAPSASYLGSLGKGRAGLEVTHRASPSWRAEKEEGLRSPRAPWRAGAGFSPGLRWDGTRQPLVQGLKAQVQGPGRKVGGLEFYLSWFLWLATLGLLVIFLGILWVKMAGPAQLEGPEENFKLLSVDCGQSTDSYCQAKQEEIIMTILYELYNYLAGKAGSFECGNPENLESKCIPVGEAKDYIENVTGYSAEKFMDALQWLLDNNKESGIWLHSDEPSEPVTSASQVVSLESARPRMSLGCRFYRALSTAITNLFIFFWTAVQSHYKEWEQNLERYPYVGILHIRDTLIPPQDRKKMKRVWDRAVDFLASNESRIQTESHRVAGEDMLVWRWTQPSYLSDSDH